MLLNQLEENLWGLFPKYCKTCIFDNATCQIVKLKQNDKLLNMCTKQYSVGINQSLNQFCGKGIFLYKKTDNPCDKHIVTVLLPERLK